MKKIIISLSILFFSAQSFSQLNLQLLGHLPFPGTTCAGVWHYVDSLNNEYALIGAGNGIAIVDVTDPANPVLKFTVPAANSLWREIKTFSHYAYATTEGGGGVTIVNLEYLPDSVQSKVYTGDGAIAGMVGSAHTCAVDDEGYLYLFGTGGLANGGAVICNLNNDPWNPEYVGQYNQNYIHDGYIINDTLWAGEIYAGQFSVIDVSNRANPVLLATQQTPGQFCHNTWLSDDHSIVYTTDEVGGAPLGAFDISDVTNIKIVSTYWTDSMPNSEVHNVRVINDFLVNPSYGSQITIVDAGRPNNLIEIANFPTGSYLCWDASPYLPSGNIIATDVGGGLYVFAPYYVRACYLEGTVTDSITGLPINGATIKVLTTPKQTASIITGEYKTGVLDPGVYDVEFSKPGYISKTISGVSLTTGNLTIVDAALSSFFISGQVVESSTLNPISGAQVMIEFSTGLKQTTIADASGNFLITGIDSGTAIVTAGKWTYVTKCQNENIPSSGQVVLLLDKGYYDDFTFDYSWTVFGTATGGMWERGKPIGTSTTVVYNPYDDVLNDCSVECYVTGNVGGNPTQGDVDDGFTMLISPVMDITTYSDPYLNYARWFVDVSGNPSFNDTLIIQMDNGSGLVDIERVHNGNTVTSSWVTKSFRINDFLAPSSTMLLSVFIEDKPGSGSTLECGLDKFFISEGPVGISESVNVADATLIFPNPVKDLMHVKTRAEITSLHISDLTGRLVQSTAGVNMGSIIQMDLTSLPAGSYLLRINSKEKVIPVRFVKL